jgi:RNA polymerase sigma-70 factor, ECF subfamily
MQRIRPPADTPTRMAAGNSTAARSPIDSPVGSPAASGLDFQTLYTGYFGFVWRCLRGLGVPAAALDDAAQDVFVVVHRRLSDFRGESSVRTWLYGIVRNVAANQRRSQRRTAGHDPLDALATQLPSRGPGPLEHVQDRQAADFVQSFLLELDDKKRDVFVLALLEELSVPEVAETLGVPLNTAYTRLRSVRLEFQSALRKKRG